MWTMMRLEFRPNSPFALSLDSPDTDGCGAWQRAIRKLIDVVKVWQVRVLKSLVEVAQLRSKRVEPMVHNVGNSNS